MSRILALQQMATDPSNNPEAISGNSCLVCSCSGSVTSQNN